MDIKRVVSQYLDSNVYVLSKDNQAIIIDAGVEVEQIAKIIADKKVQGILLTHGHYDHSLFAGEYAKTFDCKVYTSKECGKTLADGEANYSEGNFMVDDFSDFNFVSDNQKIKLGNFNILAIETKGHSKCSMCYLIGGNLFAGDTLFERGIGRTDLIGSNKEEMFESLEKLEKVEYQTCYSGHGDKSTKREQDKNIVVFKRFLKSKALQQMVENLKDK